MQLPWEITAIGAHESVAESAKLAFKSMRPSHPMRTAFRIQALLCHPQPLHGPPANQVLFHNRDRIFWLHAAVPDRLWINHDHRTMLALVQAP